MANIDLIRLNADIGPLADEMLDQVPMTDGMTYCDPAMGGGQLVARVEARLRAAGHSDAYIRTHVFGYECSLFDVMYAKARWKLVGTYEVKSLEEEKMRKHFDNIIMNPPFNLAGESSNNVSGSLGNPVAYNLFISKAFELIKPTGTVAIICPRQGIRNVNKKYKLLSYELDTSRHWKYQAGWMIAKNGKPGSPTNISLDNVIKKTCTVNQLWDTNTTGSNVEKEYTTPNGIRGIVSLASATTPVKYGKIKKERAIFGPKVMSKILETTQSYLATDDPAILSAAMCIKFDTMEEANACLLFIKNNPLMKFINGKLKTRTSMYSFTWLNRFDLRQIKTGYECPVEFNLTDGEKKQVGYIEEQVK